MNRKYYILCLIILDDNSSYIETCSYIENIFWCYIDNISFNRKSNLPLQCHDITNLQEIIQYV